MKGDVIPDIDHVARLCKGSSINEDGTVAASAFVLRQSEDYLSVNWLEYFSQLDRAGQLNEIRSVFAKKMKISNTNRLAILNVGLSRHAVREGTTSRRDLAFLHEPENHPHVDESHSGIFEIGSDDLAVVESLAASVTNVVPARPGQ